MIRLVNAAADGAGDEEVTPLRIAEAIRDCLADTDPEGPALVGKYLREGLDAVHDGLPADQVALHLYAALGVLTET